MHTLNKERPSLMRDVQITGLTPGCQDLSLTLDGHTISPRGISGLTVEAGAGEVPRLTLDVLALDITEVGGQMEVLIPEEARELLMTLGWTPPAGEAELRSESVPAGNASGQEPDRKSTRLNSSLVAISY